MRIHSSKPAQEQHNKQITCPHASQAPTAVGGETSGITFWDKPAGGRSHQVRKAWPHTAYAPMMSSVGYLLIKMDQKHANLNNPSRPCICGCCDQCPPTGETSGRARPPVIGLCNRASTSHGRRGLAPLRSMMCRPDDIRLPVLHRPGFPAGSSGIGWQIASQPFPTTRSASAPGSGACRAILSWLARQCVLVGGNPGQGQARWSFPGPRTSSPFSPRFRGLLSVLSEPPMQRNYGTNPRGGQTLNRGKSGDRGRRLRGFLPSSPTFPACLSPRISLGWVVCSSTRSCCHIKS
ncbi:hypothetical protein QBC39DRAFT_160743 [Podospora conica]|nr:hypothetical protein QBC39DRAFT_160743 [Schizothecium conicum]